MVCRCLCSAAGVDVRDAAYELNYLPTTTKHFFLSGLPWFSNKWELITGFSRHTNNRSHGIEHENWNFSRLYTAQQLYSSRFTTSQHSSKKVWLVLATLQKKEVYDWWNDPAKRFKICHILYIRKPKVAFFISCNFAFFPNECPGLCRQSS